jgi:hypothetical protein
MVKTDSRIPRVYRGTARKQGMGPKLSPVQGESAEQRIGSSAESAGSAVFNIVAA